jgi:hypothetical protein
MKLIDIQRFDLYYFQTKNVLDIQIERNFNKLYHFETKRMKYFDVLK